MTTNNANKETNGKKAKKRTGYEQVVEYLNKLDHPLKKEIEEVRKIILNTNAHITEHIKWNAPSFCYKNEDRVTFNLQGKGYFRLVFHCGAKAKDNIKARPLFEDTTGLLEWVAEDRGIVKIADMNDVEAKKVQLEQLVTKWLDVTSLDI